MAIFDLEDIFYSEADIEAEKKAHMKAQAERDKAVKMADGILHRTIDLVFRKTGKKSTEGEGGSKSEPGSGKKAKGGKKK